MSKNYGFYVNVYLSHKQNEIEFNLSNKQKML